MANAAWARPLPTLCGHSFHVRLNRRGFKYGLRAPHVERFLDVDVLLALRRAGTLGSSLSPTRTLRRARPYWLALSQGRRGSRAFSPHLINSASRRALRQARGVYAALGDDHCDADLDAVT
jgi:hypothetical protein